MSQPASETAERTSLKGPLFFGGAFLLFLIGGIWSVIAIPKIPKTPYQNSRSYALLGHRAFRELVKKEGWKVMEGRTSLGQMKSLPPIIYLAPDKEQARSFYLHSLGQEINQILSNSGRVLVALPKWGVYPSDKKKEWISQRFLLDREKVIFLPRDLLQKMDPFLTNSKLDIERVNTKIDQVDWMGGEASFFIKIHNLQVFKKIPDQAKVLVQTQKGPLVIEISPKTGEKATLVLVSDPDLFTNYGLANKENGVLALLLIDYLSDTKTQIIFDEVAHGFGVEPHIGRILLSFPAVILMIHLLLLALFLCWYLWWPFGKIQPEPRAERSRAEQIQTVGYLTYSGGDHRFFLQRFFKNTLTQLEKKFPLLPKMTFEKKLQFLKKLGDTKNVSPDILVIYDGLKKAKHPTQIEMIVKTLYNWKERLTNVKSG